jgi:hypothetical protein
VEKAAVNAQKIHVHGGSLTGAFQVDADQGGSRRSVTAASATTVTAATTTSAVATTTASASAAASAAATTVATTTASATILPRPGFVNCKAATIELPFVKPINRCLCLSIVVHFDESEALAPARRTILDHLRTLHGAKL